MIGPANPHCVSVPCRFMGYKCWMGIGSTTHKDLHGERMAPEQIDDFEQSIAQKYIRYQLNHDDNGPKLGAVVGAKAFVLPDGEKALGIMVVEYNGEEDILDLPAGGDNTKFETFSNAINVELLVELDRQNMILNPPPELTLAEKLESYFQSHIVGPDGRVRTNKYLVTEFGQFTVEVYPKDHRPAHCHIISTQRGINARFTIDPFGLLDMKQGKLTGKNKKMIFRYFRSHPGELAKLREDAELLELGS